MAKRYRVDRATLSREPELAVNCGETLLADLGPFPKAQEAVDACRAFILGYEGGELPRAHVTNGKRIIFRAWRRPDGTYQEERKDKK